VRGRKGKEGRRIKERGRQYRTEIMKGEQECSIGMECVILN
jgi:hypothetical protein